MILHTSEFCPFCHSCRLLLEVKGLEHDSVTLNLEHKANFLDKLSPYRHVPVLVDQGQRVFESAIINEYLEEVFPKISLLPSDPAEKADVRFWVNFVHARLVPAYFNLMNCNDPAQWSELNRKLSNWFRFIEKRAFKNIWVSGENLSLADVSLYPWIERFVSVERYRGGCIPDDCLKLGAWGDAMKANPAVAACAKTEQQYITFFDRYWVPCEATS